MGPFAQAGIRMEQQVSLELLILAEGLRAVGALEGPFFYLRAFVLIQVLGVRKDLQANGTFYGGVAGVVALVLVQIAFEQETLSAVFAYVGIAVNPVGYRT